MNVEMICSHCGGTNVMRDAWAVWNIEAQNWTLGAVFDYAHCDDCGGEASLSTTPIADPRVADVRCDDARLTVDLVDGRTISVPLAWYPRLHSATSEQRANWRRAETGHGVHWPDLDEDLSTEGLLRGAPAARPTRD